MSIPIKGNRTKEYLENLFGIHRTGRRILWLGDSITNGSSSSNASLTSFRARVPKAIGTAKLARNGVYEAINGGVAGNDALDALLRLPELLSTYNPDYVFIMLGTNASSSFEVYKNSMIKIIDLCEDNGSKPIIGLVPPLGAGAETASKERIVKYNLWLTLYLANKSINVIDTYAALVGDSGDMDSSYNAGDDVHPNDDGHQALSSAIYPVLNSIIEDKPWPISTSGPLGLLPNSLQPSFSGWVAAGGTAETFDRGVVDPEAGDILPYGKWFWLEVDASGDDSSKYYTRYQELTTLPNEGDKLLCFFYVKQSGGSIAGHGVKIEMANGTSAFTILTETLGVNKPGPYMEVVTVPSNPTAIRFRITVTTSAGEINIGYVGACQVYNITELGLEDFI